MGHLHLGKALPIVPAAALPMSQAMAAQPAYAVTWLGLASPATTESSASVVGGGAHPPSSGPGYYEHAYVRTANGAVRALYGKASLPEDRSPPPVFP
jgi:hypothetical protein